MSKPSFLLALPLLISATAQAQLLPPPAPQPVKPTAKATPRPTPAAASDPFVLEDPAPTEAPIVIGEPVRHQNGPTPAPPVLQKPRASVGGISIVGLSDGQAVAKIKAALAPQLKEPIRLVIGDYQYTFLREELGATLPLWPLMREARQKNGDAPLRFEVQHSALIAALKELDEQVRLDFTATALNVGASAVRVKMALETAPIVPAVRIVTMPLPKEEPKTEPSEKLPTPEPVTEGRAPSGKYPYLVASFSTHYDASLRGRTSNLKMAAQNINGTIVPPGGIFSTNNAIGPRNAAAGWQEAKMFVSGKVVSGTGAGICQAASTLYNAALLADMPIVERHAHSMRVMYVPPSRDAALMWGSKDFKFRNTTGGALRVQTWVAGRQFHVKLWGEKPRSSGPVKIVSRVLSREGGTKSEAYKLVDGQKIRLSRDSYKPHP